MLQASNLTKSYNGKFVVDNVSLSVTPGEIVGLLGPNGAGKTTTVSMLYGLVIPDSGSVHLGGFDLYKQPVQARAVIGVVPQEDNLDPDFTTEENLTRFATYYGHSLAEGYKRGKELLEIVGLGEHSDKAIDELSGGMKRRLVLARALINKPQVIFLDEPTTGLDPDARQDFWRIVLELRSIGTAVLITTHYMEEAERLCGRVLLIQEGKILDEDSPSKLSEKYVGSEVIEVHGIAVPEIGKIGTNYGLSIRNYGGGQILVLPPENADQIVREIVQHEPTKLLRRKANLEDVFLTLTGQSLE